MRAGQELILLCLHSRHRAQIPPGFTAVVTPGIPLLLLLLLPLSIQLLSLHSSLITTSTTSSVQSFPASGGRAAAYRSRSACRPVSSACRQTVRWSSSSLWSSHLFLLLRRENRGGRRRDQQLAPPLSPVRQHVLQ